jgi:hypothetical protein
MKTNLNLNLNLRKKILNTNIIPTIPTIPAITTKIASIIIIENFDPSPNPNPSIL